MYSKEYIDLSNQNNSYYRLWYNSIYNNCVIITQDTFRIINGKILL